MRMVRPKLDAPQSTVAEEQDEFLPVTVAYVLNPGYTAIPTEKGPLNTVVMAFRPSNEERAAIAGGADLYVSLLTFMRPQPGIIVSVGEHETAAMYNVAVERADSTPPSGPQQIGENPGCSLCGALADQPHAPDCANGKASKP